jgi:hypothetical protein
MAEFAFALLGIAIGFFVLVFVRVRYFSDGCSRMMTALPSTRRMIRLHEAGPARKQADYLQKAPRAHTGSVRNCLAAARGNGGTAQRVQRSSQARAIQQKAAPSVTDLVMAKRTT